MSARDGLLGNALVLGGLAAGGYLLFRAARSGDVQLEIWDELNARIDALLAGQQESSQVPTSTPSAGPSSTAGVTTSAPKVRTAPDLNIAPAHSSTRDFLTGEREVPAGARNVTSPATGADAIAEAQALLRQFASDPRRVHEAALIRQQLRAAGVTPAA